MAFRLRADVGQTLKAGLVAFFSGVWTKIAKKPYIFVIFQGGGGEGPDPLSPSGHGQYETVLFSTYLFFFHGQRNDYNFYTKNRIPGHMS